MGLFKPRCPVEQGPVPSSPEDVYQFMVLWSNVPSSRVPSRKLRVLLSGEFPTAGRLRWRRIKEELKQKTIREEPVLKSREEDPATPASIWRNPVRPARGMDVSVMDRVEMPTATFSSPPAARVTRSLSCNGRGSRGGVGSPVRAYVGYRGTDLRYPPSTTTPYPLLPPSPPVI
ncbi:unnamed protein product [Pleuronectes platessa]|uniref:Uncharacterized protein n=1 Tax=Pleuronectes platessa TaxID=8262 RepID=A0A9N7U2F9_PLEPL|nr:unnamed protein product [Pleuronectes platessa]